MNHQGKLYLVLVEADKIQSYIFQTGKLTENIGASAFIDEYNRDGAYQCLHDTKWKGNIEKDENGFRLAEDKSIISDNLDYELIYSGGGNVKIILQSYDKAKRIAGKGHYIAYQKGSIHRLLLFVKLGSLHRVPF